MTRAEIVTTLRTVERLLDDRVDVYRIVVARDENTGALTIIKRVYRGHFQRDTTSQGAKS